MKGTGTKEEEKKVEKEKSTEKVENGKKKEPEPAVDKKADSKEQNHKITVRSQ